MSESTAQFVTRMKLDELNRQRETVLAAYDRVAAAAALAPDPLTRLRVLLDGLRGIRLAGKPLHPDLAELDPLLAAADLGGASDGPVGLALDRLDSALAAGRRRTAFVHLFGVLLDEWAREGASPAAPPAAAAAERDRLVRFAAAVPPPGDPAAVLGPLLDSLGPVLADLAGRVRGAAAAPAVRGPATDDELQAVLGGMADDRYERPRLRREAGRFARDDAGRKDLLDALRLLAAAPADWDWPADGAPAEAVWTRNKWRLFARPDLPAAALARVFAGRWADLLTQTVGHRPPDPRALLEAARGRLASTIPAMQELQTTINSLRSKIESESGVGARADFLRSGIGPDDPRLDLGYHEPADPWAAAPGYDPATEPLPGFDPDAEPDYDSEFASLEPRGPQPGSVRTTRAEMQRRLRDLAADPDGYGYDRGHVSPVVQLVHAEVRLLRAAFPDRPVWVVKLDLRDCYPSLPHDALLYLLGRTGVPDADRDFLAKFLVPAYQTAGGPVRAGRGVPTGHRLSAVLAELLLRLLERHIHMGAAVRVIRLVDDVCVLAPTAEDAVRAWNRVHSFCQGLGLEVNADKCGAVAVGGGDVPAGLPTALPRWAMLELGPDGEWAVHEPTFAAHLGQSRERVEQAAATFSKVLQFNANVGFLLNAVAAGGNLGPGHRAAVAAAVRRFHHDFFGPGRGAVAGLLAGVRPLLGPDAPDIPVGWAHWPLTAGGIGLADPILSAARFAGPDQNPLIPTTREYRWDELDNGWARCYADWLTGRDERRPAGSAFLDALVQDFIARGREVSAGRQHDLSGYWRWVLAVYGPEVLARFGTFRFLVAELVPLQLIGRRLVGETAAGGE